MFPLAPAASPVSELLHVLSVPPAWHFDTYATTLLAMSKDKSAALYSLLIYYSEVAIAFKG